MPNQNEYDFEVLVLGGGPAGIAAACAAASHASVAIVDENPAVGGQVWRNAFDTKPVYPPARWRRRLKKLEITRLHGLRVFDAPAPNTLHAEGPDGLNILHYKQLILATGARERFLPFPGWTIPNVLGAGALQTMVKSGLPIAGKHVVIAGSGPLLLAVATFLKSQQAQITCICEQASRRQLLSFATHISATPSKFIRTAQYRFQLAATPYRIGWWPAAAQGESQLESVTITNGRRRQNIPCDYLACGFHLVPNLELPNLLGCQIHRGFVSVKSAQETSIPNIFAAGEITGIGGLEKSLIEGSIAGYSATGQFTAAQKLTAKREKTQRFVEALHRAFDLRDALRQLPMPSTLVCRCEDVPHERLHPHHSWRSAKLHTRCGMGACQGRICGSATQFLYGWPTESVRPPILPVRFETMAKADEPAAQPEKPL